MTSSYKYISFFLFLFFFPTRSFTQTCNNWLNIPDQNSFFGIGDLDVPGNKITVEATFNRTTTWNGTDLYQGDLVSKHRGPNDCNYLLRPSSAEITTSAGYYKTPEICPIALNKTYHAAMVYDGVSLKFYRNGILMSQISATGNLIQNDFLTQIGLYYSRITQESFIGFINEVRIWNVARTQQQIQANINSSLQNPAAQPGLLAYYTFDNLINKQGNSAWNGSLNSNATVNSNNPNCSPIVASHVDAGKDTLVCEGSAVQLNAKGAASYTWTPTTGLSNPSVANPVATVSATTTYIVTGSIANDCAAKDTVTINILPKPIITASNDTTICSSILGNAVIQLNATGAQQYQWLPPTGLSNASISNPVASVSVSATYIITGTSVTGCSAKDTVTVNIAAKPIITASDDTVICSGSTNIPLYATGALRYQWFPTAGLSNPAVADPIAAVSTNTTYIVTGTTSAGCFAKDTVLIKVLPKPIITLSNDTLICSKSFAPLSAAGGNQYQWYPSYNLSNTTIPNPVATPLQSTKYFVTVTADNNCMAKDSVEINVKPVATFSVKQINDGICEGSSAQLQANGGDTYLWQPAYNLSNSRIPNPVAKPDTNITYKVLIKDSYCHNDTTLTVELKVNARPQIHLTKNGDFNCNRSTVQLNVSGGNTYSWTPSEVLNNPNISNPIAYVPASTTFYVSAKSVDGCEVKDSIHIAFNGANDLNNFQLPTAFTPNGDGLNDCFGIKKWGNVEVRRMEIYNRWGQAVFTGKGVTDCWDGSINGQPQQTGAFPYLIKVKTVCGEVEKRGVVMLIR